MEIAETEWAKDIKKYVPSMYDMFINIASDPELMVNVYKRDGYWAIEARNILEDFILDYTFTKEQAIALCFEMGWSIR